jgi:XdhC Rossmann domain
MRHRPSLDSWPDTRDGPSKEATTKNVGRHDTPPVRPRTSVWSWRAVDQAGSEAELDRLAAPIGLDLGATSPEETALSILAEVVAVRNGHEGGRLSTAAGRIHEVGA